MTLNDLGAYIHTSSATVTGVVDSLERDGWVERIRNPDDRRSTMAKLTRKGVTTMARVFALHHRNIEAVLKKLTIAERKTLVQFLSKIAEGLDDFEHLQLTEVLKSNGKP